MEGLLNGAKLGSLKGTLLGFKNGAKLGLEEGLNSKDTLGLKDSDKEEKSAVEFNEIPKA